MQLRMHDTRQPTNLVAQPRVFARTSSPQRESLSGSMGIEASWRALWSSRGGNRCAGTAGLSGPPFCSMHSEHSNCFSRAVAALTSAACKAAAISLSVPEAIRIVAPRGKMAASNLSSATAQAPNPEVDQSALLQIPNLLTSFSDWTLAVQAVNIRSADQIDILRP